MYNILDRPPFLFLLEVGEILESGGMAPVEGRAYCEGGEEGECGGRGALRLLRLLAACQVDSPALRHHTSSYDFKVTVSREEAF